MNEYRKIAVMKTKVLLPGGFMVRAGKYLQISYALPMFLTFFFMLSFVAFSHAGNCPDCERNLTWPKVRNFLPKDYDSKNEAWMRCMGEQLEYEYLTDEATEFIAALEKCREFETDKSIKSFADPSSIVGHIANIIITDCFGIAGYHPEYEFRVVFDPRPDGSESFVWRESERKLESRFVLELWYDGDEPEMLKQWETGSSLDSIGAHYRRMFLNSDALLRKDLPLENMLWRFERRPVKCRMDVGKKQLVVGDTTSVDLSGFLSMEGQPSREFNRIILCAKNGEVTGGTRSRNDPKCSVFKVGSGEIRATYHTPMSFQYERDVITVHNSCDIAKQTLQPLEETQTRKPLATEDISIVFPPVGAIVTRKITEVFHNEKNEPRKVEKVSYTKEIEVTLLFTFSDNARPLHGIDSDRIDGNIRKLQYRPVKVDVLRSSYSRNGVSHHERRNPHGLELETHTVYRESAAQAQVEELDSNDVLNLYIHPSTGKVSEAHLPYLDVDIEVHNEADWRRRELRNDQLVTTDGVRSDDRTINFAVQPTVDDLEECDRMSGGDGIHRMTGGCTEVRPRRYKTTTESYRWEVFRH